MKLIPFPVTDKDYWLSLPLEGLTPHAVAIAMRQYTPLFLATSAVKDIMSTVARKRGHRCQYCTKRKVSRLFLIFRPEDNARLTGFVVCETCADQMKQDVTD
jgi:hypothetical protein